MLTDMIDFDIKSLENCIDELDEGLMLLPVRDRNLRAKDVLSEAKLKDLKEVNVLAQKTLSVENKEPKSIASTSIMIPKETAKDQGVVENQRKLKRAHEQLVAPPIHSHRVYGRPTTQPKRVQQEVVLPPNQPQTLQGSGMPRKRARKGSQSHIKGVMAAFGDPNKKLPE